jgi:leucyl aminopeptidase (aminopeptidase T)
MNNSLRKPAETAVVQCMDLGADESCLVVTDDRREAIGEALDAVAREQTDDTTYLRYPPGEQHGEEPPEPVAAAMAGADVVLAPTTKSLSHTQARIDANEAGARVATMPGITDGTFLMGVDADYPRIAKTCEEMHAAVADADEIRVTAPQGTQVMIKPGDREWHQDTGLVHEPGEMTNLPAGEVFVSPVQVDGTIVVDGTMMPHGRLDDDETVRFTVEDSQIQELNDEQLSDELATAAEEAGPGAFNLAEFGIGTNVAISELVGSVLLDEKAAGTVHFAIGDDHAIGGDTEAPIHLDGILTEPTVTVDGEELLLPSPD